MNQKIIIEALSMDLKRVALGLQRGSLKMAKRFKEEALEREKELEKQELNDYLKKLVKKSKRILLGKDEKMAEDALMYSTLFQNFAQKYFKL
ncbi:hypothetical protein HY025_04875 [Candidatus Daviesbacteria bacterium]|nr:hypothetical protein [Candidatus Daviesbacteria bacterium]